MEHIVTIITAFLTFIIGIATAYFGYNQRTKDKMTDLKIEKLKQDHDSRIATNNRHIAVILGEMWELIHKLNADRCFIIQPHPEHRHLFLSVALEVNRKGVSQVKDIFQNIPINDTAGFVKMLATNVWQYIDDIEKQVNEKRIQSIMFLAGSKQIAIRQLVDVKNSWIGSLVVENINHKEYNADASMEIIKSSANIIQFILPPI